MAFAAACVLGLCAGVARAQFTTTWTGSAASGDWSTAGNWNNGAPTTSGTWALTFANTTQTSSTNTTGGASDTVTLSSLTITSNTAVALARTESRTLTLINNSSIYIGGTNSINHTSSIPLTLLGSSTVSGVSNRNLQWNAVISGTGSLSLTGGTLYLGSGVVNTFSGGLTISSGASLDVAGISALGTGPLTINGGLLNARGGLRTVTNSGVINGDFTFGGTNPLVLSGSFDLNGGTRVITLNGSPNAGTMSGVISNGGITKAGLAPLVLSGTNTYSGATTINSGTLQIGSGATTGSLNPASTITGSAGATLAFNRSNSVTQGTDFTSVISGSIGVAQVGSGTLVLGGANTYSGKTSIQNGTLSVATINNASASGNLGTNATIDFGSSTTAGALVYTGAGETTNRVVNLAATTGGGVLDQSGSGLLRFTADVTTTGVGPKTLTVRGSTAGTGELSGRITDGVTGTTTLTSQFGTGTTTITLDSVSGISVGAAISGANIPASTTVTAINAATRVITLSQATTTGTTAAGSLITVAGVTNPNTLTKAGTGTWTLSGSNSYTGTTSINAGMLQIGSGSTAGSLSTSSVITGSAGATLAFNRSDTVTQGTDFNSVIGGAINVAQVGSGAFTLSGANTHTGTTSISNGTLVLANVLAVQNSTLDTGAVGSQAITFTVAGTNTYTLGGLQGFNGLAIGANTISVGGNNASTTFSGAIAGAGGGLTKAGTGLLTLSGTNTYTGITTLNSGTLRAGAAAGGQAFGNLSAVSLANTAGVTLDLNGFSQTIGSLAGGGASGGAVSLGAGTLTTGGDNTSTSFAGIISGSGGLTKSGTGTLTLSGANTYSGLTTVSAGALATTADNRIPSGSSIVMAGGTLQFGGNNTVAAISGTAGTIDVGVSRLTSSVTTSSTFSGTLVGNRPASAGQGASGFQKSGSGTLTLAGNVSLSVDSSIAQGYNNPLQVSAGELVLAGTTTLTNVENRISGTGAVERITSGSHSLYAVNMANGTFIVDNGFVTTQGMSIGYGNVAGATNVVTINGGTLSSPSANITLGNNTGATQTSTLNLNGGVVETKTIANGGSSSNLITFNGGTLRMLGTSMIPSNANSAGNLLALNVGNGGAILDTGTFANTISLGFVGIGSGGLTKLGSAQLTLSGTSTYTGATTLTSGTLRAGAAAGGQAFGNLSAVSLANAAGVTLDLNGFSQTIGSLAGGGASGGAVSLGAGTLTTGGDNTTTSFAGIISGNGGLTKSGSGAFTLSGVNTHTGTTSVSNGTLVLANVLAVQNSTLDTGAVGSQAITFTVAGTNTYTFGGLQGSNGLAIGANTISVGGNNASTTFSGAIAGAGGGLTKTGTGLLTLSGTNTYTGITTLNSGTLRAGAAAGGQAFGNLSAVSLANAAGVTLDLNGFSQTIGSLAGGGASGGAVSLGAGTLTTGGDNTSTSFAGIISGSGGLTKTGTGVLTLSGANTYTGLTTVAAGVLATTADSRIPGGSSIVMSGGTLQFGGGNTVAAISGTAGTIDISSYRLTSSLATSSTFSGTLVGNRPASAGQGASGFQKSGSGTLTLAGNVLLSVDSSVAQGFNNPLQVNAGELVLAGTTTLTNVENRINGTGAVQRITNGSHSLNSVNIQNGTFIVDNGFVAVQGMSIGFSSVTGATNVVTINGGTLSSPSAGISLGNNTGATQTPTLNLNGGALETISIPNGGSGTNSITFNGGTLRMLGTSVIPSNTNSGGNLLALNVGDGGAILDTGTFANTISQGFVGVGSGGLTKLGSAQLTLSGTSTYTGATTVSAGTLAFDRIAALATTSGIGIASGAGLTYTGTTGALNRAITVTSGTGTVRNSGGGTLTLGGTLTKDGSVLRLTGGRFNVTGQIVGSSPNSDLLVDGTSTVTLSTVNSYNGPTFVNQASNLIVGVNDAIPNGSTVTLGSATTTGTLTLGSFSDAIGGLAFGAGGGTLRMTASATGATAQLTAASGTMNLSGGTLDLTGSGTSDGLYRLLSAQSITNAFTNITGTTTAYQILTTSTSIDYQQRAVLGTVSVTNPSVSIITGGSAAFTYTVANNALSGGAGLTFTGAGLANVVGSTLGSVNAGGTSDAIAGLVFTGTSIGSSQQGTFTVSDPSAFGTTSATGIVSVNVLNHSLASFEASDTATLSLDLGTYDTASGWTSGSGSLGFSIWNIASGGFANADTAGLALYDVVFTSGNDVFSTGLTNFANLASGTFNGSTASVLAPGSLAEGTYQGVYTLKFRDQQNLSGAANTRDLTLTANVIVVPEPGAFMLAGIGIGLAGWLLRRTGR